MERHQEASGMKVGAGDLLLLLLGVERGCDCVKQT